MLERLTPKMLIALAAGGSVSVLIGALIFQAIGYAPCDLCILQRWPHLAAAIIGGAMLIFSLPRIFALLGAAAAATTGVLGVYHSGVERHIFAGPDTCTSNGVGGLSVDDLMAQINGAPLIRCDEIVWDIFGITMPNLNALASFAFVALWIWAFAAAKRAA